MTRQIVKPELLAPAGNMEKCKMALRYGADAVYLGGKMFGLRAFANNFEIDEIKEAADFAHSLGKKVYVTVNIFAHNSDIEKLPEYLLALQKAGADALLISDLGVWQTARRVVPGMPLHVSTQANTTNWESVQAWQELGAERVVLARELRWKKLHKSAQKQCGTGSLCTRRNVHILQRPLPFEQLPYGARRKPRRMCAGLPLGIHPARKEPPRRKLRY